MARKLNAEALEFVPTQLGAGGEGTNPPDRPTGARGGHHSTQSADRQGRPGGIKGSWRRSHSRGGVRPNGREGAPGETEQGAVRVLEGRGYPSSRSTNSTGSSERAAPDPTAHARPVASTVFGPGQGQVSGRGGRSRNRGQRRRRTQDEQAPPVGDRAGRGATLPPRPRRATRVDGAHASDSCTGTARRRRSRAGADPSSRSVTRTEGRMDGSSNAGDGRVLEASRELGREVSPVSTPSLEEGGQEEAFPALPQSAGHRESPERPPMPSGSTTGLDYLDYSTLAEKLAEEAEAAAAAAERPSSRAEGRSTRGSLSRLSVLPGFGDGRSSEHRLRGSKSDTSPGMDESPMSELSSKKLPGAEEKHGDGSLAQSLPPPSRSDVADHVAGKKRRAGAAAETVALRARLRERWFRLEATRKAQRQRESAERGMMATEDENVNGGNGVCADPSGDVDDIEGSGGNHDSSGDRDTISSCGETDDRAFPQGPGVSSSIAPARKAHSIADVSPVESRAVSASGVAAMKRTAEAAAASNAATPTTGSTASSGSSEAFVGHHHLPRRSTPDKLNASVVAAGLDDTRELCEVGDGGMVHPEERVHAACEAGMAGILNELLVRSGGRAAEGKDKLRRTPLHLAAEVGSLECVNLLLKRGTRLDQRDRRRETPLHKAARSGNSGVVKALCTARMKVNVRNRHRETPLLLAVRAGGADAVSVLLGFGARLDEPDVNGVTPVVQAAMTGQAELLMAMANSNQAWKSSHREGGAADDQPSRVQGNVIGRRRDMPSALHQTSARGGGGKGSGVPAPALSPVHEAAASGQTETLSLLLELGVSVEETDPAAGAEGDTPLGRAIRVGQLDCARLLLDAGAMIGRENARGETPLVVAVRAGQASAVEFLAKFGAPLDGGRSNGRLTTANGRAPAGAREKMLARRRVDPLELALREGQFACAAVLIEGGARIEEGTLRALKLEPTEVASRGTIQGTRTRYAGSISSPSAAGTYLFASTESAAASASTMLPLQKEIFRLMPPEIFDLAFSAPPDGGGLQHDDDTTSSQETWQEQHPPSGKISMGAHRGRTEGQLVEYVGGLLPSLGEYDVVLVLGDGSRMPAHSCLLAAFSGTFRDLFLGRSGNHCHGEGCTYSKPCSGYPHGHLAAEATPVARTGALEESATASNENVGQDDRRKRSRDVQPLLTKRKLASEAASDGRRPSTSAYTSEVAVEVAAFAVTSIAENGAWQSPAILHWRSPRGEVLVRFWGAGTMAAVVRHVYTGQPPSELHAHALGRLLVASVSLRMPRLMRQVEHLLSSSISVQKSNDRSALHTEVAVLLRAARVLRATDLEDRCTLYMQANGVFPAVMKLRRELRIPSLNASDVSRGLARLAGSGYLGSGPAHAWSSSGDTSATSAMAAAKRAVDLPLRKRAVDFDQLIPLLLDPARCASTLSVGYPERALLLTAAMTGARSGTTETLPGRTTGGPDQLQRDGLSQRCRVCSVGGGGEGCRKGNSNSIRGSKGPPVSPLESNFSAFSRGLGWLRRTGTLADVVLVLPTNPCRQDGSGEVSQDLVDKDGDNRPTAVLQASEGASEDANDKKIRFLAHSLVLASRSEKFAAMLRFVRRQDGSEACPVGDGGNSVGDGSDSGVESAGETDCCTGQSNACKDGGATPVGGFQPGGTEAGCGELEVGGSGVDVSSIEGGCRPRRHHQHRCPLRRRPRRDLMPRELELHSPLLTARCLGLFLDFLYTGVLSPSLSTRELSELALVADEYLVLDLTQQAEALLVERLHLPHTAGGSSNSSPSPGRFTFSTATTHHANRDEDTSSMPLDILQLGVSLGLRALSAAAARAVLLQLDRVSTSEAFEASGMSKRELVVAALEAIRS